MAVTALKRKEVVYMAKTDKNDDDILHIRMFGEFSITNTSHTLTVSNKMGLSSSLLLSFLLSNYGNEVTSDSLIDMLWPEDSSSNPGGALRTLTYRTRSMLKPFYPQKEVEYIKRINNIYIWNQDIPCSIDILEFEHLCNAGFQEKSAPNQYGILTEAFKLYKGEFLPTFSQQPWVIYRSNYYGNLFIRCVNQMCHYLEEHKEYEELLALCNKALELAPPTDETLHKQKIRAMLNIGQTQSALDYYYSVLSLFSQNYGIDSTESMQDVYAEILSNMPNQYQTISALEENLRNKQIESGSYYCNFDIFQNFYQLNLRSVRRSRSHHFLVLLTLSDTDINSMITSQLKEEMDILHSVMSKLLRGNDVYTKSSICQFSLIISVPNENGCHIVVRRLTENYEKKKKYPNIQLLVDIKEIH